MRRELIEELLKEVLGPRGGACEQMEQNPAREYITGVIQSARCRHTPVSPDAEITVERGETPLADDDTPEDIPVLQVQEHGLHVRPRSFGISFAVNSRDPSFRVCVTWGRYKKIKGENGKTVWQRIPHFSIREISMKGKNYVRENLCDEGGGSVYLVARKETRGQNLSTVVLMVVNDLPVEKSCTADRMTESSIFQPSIRVILNPPYQLASLEKERNHGVFSFLYRMRPVHARGFMCSAIWKDVDYTDFIDENILWADGVHFQECRDFFRPHVRSEFVPMYPVPSPEFSWPDDLQKPEFSARRLSELWDEEEIRKALSPLVEEYRGWIDENRKIAEHFEGNHRRIAEQLINLQKEALERLESGLDILLKNRDARLSFCFANRVIWLQNRWKGRDDFTWRPFQLAFILMNLESICNERSKYRNFVDLLWAPTGGGKTEAYLGLAAFTIALRRRRARTSSGVNPTGGGTAVISRYTLRLLTVQQFRRILAMITAAEYLRVCPSDGKTGWRPEKCDIEDDWLYGTVRFSAGLWVGGRVTPNHLWRSGQVAGAIDILQGSEGEGDPAQVLRCPACGSWLALPRGGLPPGKNTLHLVARVDRTRVELETRAVPRIKELEHITDVKLSEKGLKKGYLTFSLTVESRAGLKSADIDDLWRKIEKLTGAGIASFRASRPGYFGTGREPGRRIEKPLDFEIYCPNPDCVLGTGVRHGEGVPACLPDEESGEKLPDGLLLRKPDVPFLPGTRIPVPAYTVDEQIYHRCPAVIVSTADKIARLAYEPRAGGIFGSVSMYNPCYGYLKNPDLFPREPTKASRSLSVEVPPFEPPELIIQDELHLLDGPLGSMFGLFENAVDILIREGGRIPKRIASTATIRRAETQVRNLFASEVFQFPPHGLTIEDSFFVRHSPLEKGWEEDFPGRIYAGLYSTGLGPLTPIVRIWSRLLKETHDRRENRAAIYYWTLTGYFNAVRELAGAVGLYKEDIVERLGNISSGTPRPISPERIFELSSRIDSTDIPLILDELERGEEKELDENPDAIFATSMFGTGVDVPHLSLMVVHGQPKTTSQYIQATGRIGRKHGGLVITFLRAGRIRDLSHYEMFAGYHHRIYMEIEPPSVSPFSSGALDRAAGPAMVAFLRNMRMPAVGWWTDDGTVILGDRADGDVEKFLRKLEIRAARMLSEGEAGDIRHYFSSQRDRWEHVARRLGKGNLVFAEYPYRTVRKNVVLGTPAHTRAEIAGRDIHVVYRDSPQSLREVEETVSLEV